MCVALCWIIKVPGWAQGCVLRKQTLSSAYENLPGPPATRKWEDPMTGQVTTKGWRSPGPGQEDYLNNAGGCISRSQIGILHM